MKNKKLYLKVKLIGLSISIFFTIAALVIIPVYAWLVGREIVAYAPIDTSTALFIGAGNEEDIKYLSFEGIDVSGENGKKYFDYVFSVTGESVKYYKLQLAFTTNNSFTFDLYRATTEVVANPEGVVNYQTHNSAGVVTGTIRYYIVPNGKVAGVYKNDKNNDKIGDDSGNFYNATYGQITDQGAYTTGYANVDQNAVPLYWQTASKIEAVFEEGTLKFTDYYILRLYNGYPQEENGEVTIVGGKVNNDRETDIICISAKSFSDGN